MSHKRGSVDRRRRRPAKRPVDASRVAFDRMTSAVARYLEAKGWNVVMLGPAVIEQEPGARKYNFRFVLGLTGSKREEPADRG